MKKNIYKIILFISVVLYWWGTTVLMGNTEINFLDKSTDFWVGFCNTFSIGFIWWILYEKIRD